MGRIQTYRVVRGGAFNNDNPRNFRAAYRNRNHPDNRNDSIGFRVVVSTFFIRRHCPPGRSLRDEAKRWPGLLLAAPGRAGEYQRPRALVRLARGHFREGSSMLASAPTFEQVCDWGNLLRAYRRAAAGKRRRPNVAAFEHRLEDELVTLREELLAGTYRPGPYRTFVIHEPKRRVISAALFRDRVVHHALCQIIEPVFEPSFVRDTFANRVGFGRTARWIAPSGSPGDTGTCCNATCGSSFPASTTPVLIDVLASKLAHTRLLGLAAAVLASGSSELVEEYDMVYVRGDGLFAVERPRGLPIGNLTSQLWANVYFNGFDHFVKRELRCPAYVRYVDDLLLFGHDPDLLWQWKRAVDRRLEQLRVTMHPGAHPRPVTEGFPFLGFVVYPERRRIKRRKAIHAQRRLALVAAAYRAGQVPLVAVTASVRGWVNHARYGNTVGLRKAMLARVLLRSPHFGAVGPRESRTVA